MPEITVVVPVYKVEKYLRKCIDSILIQSFQNFDLVLVDDGSPDICPQICDEYAGKDTRITVIHKQNGGLSDARNAGIDWAMEHSDSQWLAFVDSDDYIHPDYLRVLYETAQRESADLVICDFIRVSVREEVVEEEHRFYDLVTEDKSKLFECMGANWRIVTAWNKLYHKHIFDELRFAVGRIHEDAFAIHHVLWNCNKAAFISDKLYFYRIRDNSIMATETPRSKLDGLEATVEQYEFCIEHDAIAHVAAPTIDYLNEFAIMQSAFDKQEARRFKELKRRLGKIYFSYPDNRNLKRVFGFVFSGLYSKIAALLK